MSMSNLAAFLSLFRSSSDTNNTSDSRRQVLTRLKFIGTIQAHEKIDSRSLKIESTNIFTPLKRMFFTGDSRESTLHFFSNTIDRSFEIISAYIHSSKVSEQIFCSNIIQDLISSVRGLQSMQKTYADDKLIVSEINVLIESIQAFIFDIQQTHPQIFTIKDLCILKINDTTSKDTYKLNPLNQPNVESIKLISNLISNPISLRDDEDD